MALRPLNLDEWIAPNGDLEAHLAEKDRLLAERRAEVFAALPGSEAAQHELLARLVAFLPLRFPDIYRRTGDTFQIGPDRNVALSECSSALLTAGRLVQEDFC